MYNIKRKTVIGYVGISNRPVWAQMNENAVEFYTLDLAGKEILANQEEVFIASKQCEFSLQELVTILQ